MGGGIHIRDKRKGDAAVKALMKKRKRILAVAEIGEGAGLRLEKKVEKLEGEVKMLSAQSADVWAWWKNMQEGKDGSA